jgi:predicted small secreted protein
MFKLTMLLTAVLSLTACEAAKGLGRDLQNLGQAIDDAV